MEFLCHELLAQFGREFGTRLARLIVHNGRADGGAWVVERGCEPVEAPLGSPQYGEADVAVPAWAIALRRDMPQARITVVTVDTDLVPLMMVHGGERCSVALMHNDDKHRMCVDTHVLAKTR